MSASDQGKMRRANFILISAGNPVLQGREEGVAGI
jgi:hypothetical protein